MTKRDRQFLERMATRLDRAGNHILEMGCTCVDGQHRNCMGWKYAVEFWAASVRLKKWIVKRQS